MTRQQPTDDEVRLAMNLVLAEAAATKRKATITAVERRLGVAHPTFYRNYPELIDWFKRQAAEQHTPADTARSRGADADETLARLRRENENLRRTVKIYAEAIRQLTLERTELEEALRHRSGVVDLAARREARAGHGPQACPPRPTR